MSDNEEGDETSTGPSATEVNSDGEASTRSDETEEASDETVTDAGDGYSPLTGSQETGTTPDESPSTDAASGPGSAGHQPDSESGAGGRSDGQQSPDRDLAAAKSSPGAGEAATEAQTESGDPTDIAGDGTPDSTNTGGGLVDGVDEDGGPTDHEIPADVRAYDRFSKVDGAQYERVNEFLRDRTYITAREWAIARLCADFRTETGVEMTKVGENLPELVPFMTDEYSPQAVNQARSAFERKVSKAGATFLYGAMSGFFTADELDTVLYEATETAKFLLEVEGVDLTVEEELEAEERISTVMREVRQASDELRHDSVECPHCGEDFDPTDA